MNDQLGRLGNVGHLRPDRAASDQSLAGWRGGSAEAAAGRDVCAHGAR